VEWGHGQRLADPSAGEASPSQQEVFQSSAPRSSRVRVHTAAIVVLGLIAFSAFLSVNTFPVITNDSVLYLEHSLDLAEGGWVTYGYRQFGYPLVLAVVRGLADPLSIEPFLAMVILQRLLLAASAILAWWFWRWWALPFLAFLLAAETIAYSNFLLTEGLALSIAALLIFPISLFLNALKSDVSADANRRMRLMGALIVAGVVILFSIRFTYAVFGVVPLLMVFAGWRTPYRRLTLSMLGITLLVTGLFTIFLSFENQREEGVFSPSAGGQPAGYYFAWMQVFRLHPENRVDPELSEFFDAGVVHDFSREVSALDLSYEEQSGQYQTEIESMLRAADVPVFGSKIQSTLFALLGGRLDDIQSTVEGVVASTRFTVDGLINSNQFASRNGAQAFADEYNDSQLPHAVITDPIGALPPIPRVRRVLAVLLPLGMVVMLAGLWFPRSRPLSAIGLSVTLSFAVGVGWIRADNFRFLVTTSVFGLGVACAVLATLIGHRSVSGPTSEQQALRTQSDRAR